jgi:AcrR family transcriptional regulator
MVDVTPRKTPRQQRSREMDGFILEAAARILEEKGPEGFNTNRIAERAGISVGSLYQYYPNKAALLFRLQERENSATLDRVETCLCDGSRSHRDRLCDAVQTFFESEAAESPLRKGLQQAHIHFRHTPVFVEIEERALIMIRRFLAEARPDRTGNDEFEAQLLLIVLSSVAECLTERGMTGRELRHWADACAAMLANHIQL